MPKMLRMTKVTEDLTRNLGCYPLSIEMTFATELKYHVKT